MANTVDKVINIASDEVGYMEKSSSAYKKNPSILYEKTAGAGKDNYTKYGKEMHDLYPSVMDFPASWCDAFVDWCFQKAYGVSNAKGLLSGNFNDYTPSSAQLYKNKGAWYKSNPKIGDQIFFKNSSRICHTGIVYKVDSTYVYTIEGNTSSDNDTVISNGGMVCKKKYKLTNSRIAGYGRPKYDVVASSSSSASSKKTNVEIGQDWLNDNYGTIIKKTTGKLLDIDGKYGSHSKWAALLVWKDVMNRKYGSSLTLSNKNFGDTCKKYASNAVVKRGTEGTFTYICQFILAAKGFYKGKMDGKCGSGTESAIEKFQESVGLSVDGRCGKNTWYKLFN